MDIRIQAKGNKSTALAKAAASPARAYFLTAESLKEHRGGEEHIFLEVSKEPLVNTVRLPQCLTLSWAVLVSPISVQNSRFENFHQFWR